MENKKIKNLKMKVEELKMKKFKSVESFDKFLEKEFGFGLEENFEDVKSFVGEEEFRVDFESEDEMIIELKGKKYYMVERNEGIKFVEVE